VKRTVVFAGSVWLWSVGGALAQGEAVDDGVYVRVGAGATFVSDWQQDITYNPNQLFIAIPLAQGQTISNSAGFAAVAALGFDYADGIRTELEYRYATSPIDSFVTEGGFRAGLPAPVNDDINAHFVFSNFYFDFHNSSRLTPFIGAGVGGAFVENENGDRDAALAYQGRAGVSLAIGGGFSADMEYIYLRTNKLVYGPADEDFTPAGPPVRIDGDRYQSSSVMLSLRKQF